VTGFDPGNGSHPGPEPDPVYYGWRDDDGEYVVHIARGWSTSLSRTVCGARLPYWSSALGVATEPLDPERVPVVLGDTRPCVVCVEAVVTGKQGDAT